MTAIPNRQQIQHEAQEQASFFLRSFDPKLYNTYYQRIYNPVAFFEQIGINKICELIEHGNSLLNVAEKLDISGSALRRWVKSKKEYFVLVQEAYVYAGEMFAYKAEQALKDSAGRGKEAVALARALAEHYRWMASRLNKEMFGDKKEDGGVVKPPLVLNLNFGDVTQEKEVAIRKEALTASFMKLSDE